MRNLRESLVSALAGVFGLRLDEKALWPDMILGACLSFCLLISVALLVSLVINLTFVISTSAAIVFILLAKNRKAVLGAALLFVGLRSLVAVILGLQWKAILLVLICFGLGGLLLWGNRNEGPTDGAPSN